MEIVLTLFRAKLLIVVAAAVVVVVAAAAVADSERMMKRQACVKVKVILSNCFQSLNITLSLHSFGIVNLTV